MILVIGVVVAVSGGDDDDASTLSTETTAASETTEAAPATTEAAPATTEAAPATTTPPDTTETPATTTPPDTTPTCGYLGTDSFGDMQVELLFTNPLGAIPSLDVTFGLTGSDGVRFLTGNERVGIPLPDERFRIQADTITDLPPGVDEAAIACEVLAIEEGFGETPELPGPGDVCEFVSIDDFGDIQVQLNVTSPFTTTEDLRISYALRGPSDTRFSDSTASVDFVGAGETVRVSEDTVTEPPSWVGDEITCGILGVEAS